MKAHLYHNVDGADDPKSSGYDVEIEISNTFSPDTGAIFDATEVGGTAAIVGRIYDLQIENSPDLHRVRIDKKSDKTLTIALM